MPFKKAPYPVDHSPVAWDDVPRGVLNHISLLHIEQLCQCPALLCRDLPILIAHTINMQGRQLDAANGFLELLVFGHW